MPEIPTFAELSARIQQAKKHHGGVIPRDVACAWNGYIAALLEWGLISVGDHSRLCDLLPKIEGEDPTMKIFLGYEKEA